MRPLTLEIHSPDQLVAAFRDIVEASQEDIATTVFDVLVVSNVTETRTLDCSTATLDDVRNFLGTIVQDIQSRR